MGRIHVGRQDLDELQTRKMKGLKRSRTEREEGEDDGETNNDDNGDDDDEEGEEDDDDAMSLNSDTRGDESEGESVEDGDDDKDDKGGVPLNKKARLDNGM